MSETRITMGNKIPSPPPAPELVVPGYNSEGYWDLIQSLLVDERELLLNELKTAKIIAAAEALEKDLKQFGMLGKNLKDPRTTFLAALLLLQKNKISKNQLATLHLLDSAIRTLYTSPASYMVHRFSHNNKTQSVTSFALFPPSTIANFPNDLRVVRFGVSPLPNSNMKLEDLPLHMRAPLLQRFFNLDPREWKYFCDEIARAPVLEQYAYVLQAPEFGCWSSMIFHIQKYLKCMKVLELKVQSGGEIIDETVMLVPSFSMFQAAINAKAKAIERKPAQLVPTYGYVDNESYSRYKSVGKIALTMYLPERNPQYQYNDHLGNFRRSIDNHRHETSFAGAIHDVYHALREIGLSENIAEARFRLAGIAKNHPNNKIHQNARGIDEILIDGELLYCYPAHKDTIFELDFRSSRTEDFSDLFAELGSELHEDLKRAFIADMVVNHDEWAETFKLGRNDLSERDQVIYDDIYGELVLNSMRLG